MELTRRQFALLLAALYLGAGVLLASDYMAHPAEPGAHLPLAWHVFPISVLAFLVSVVSDTSSPLDPAWHVSVEIVVAAYAIALMICAGLIYWLFSRRSKFAAQAGSDADS